MMPEVKGSIGIANEAENRRTHDRFPIGCSITVGEVKLGIIITPESVGACIYIRARP